MSGLIIRRYILSVDCLKYRQSRLCELVVVNATEPEFFPNTLRYRELLEYFFQIHNPTTLHRQGNDIGSNYRSAIFVTSTEQRLLAERLIAAIDASGKWPGKIMTEINKAPRFWPAESEHQDHLQRNPNGYTCHFDRLGWALPR